MSEIKKRAGKNKKAPPLWSLKSVWQPTGVRPWSFICPVCQAARKIPGRPRPSLKHVFQIALCAVVFSLATWHWFAWKGIVSFIPFWIVFEFIFRSRMRAAVRCPHCGFDAFLFMVDSEWAKEELEKHWRQKFLEKGIPFPDSELKKGQAQLRQTAATDASGPP